MSDLEKNEFTDLEQDWEDSYEVVTLVDDSGNERDFLIIDLIEQDGVTYCLIIDSDDEDDESAEAVIVKEVEAGNGEVMYEELVDDAEFEKIAALFKGDNEDYTLEV